MRPFTAAFLVGLSLACGAQATAQTSRALLLGINTYQPVGSSAEHPPGCIYGRCELGAFENLDGAVNDASAMADLLTSPKFGFLAAQVVLLTNPNPVHPRSGTTILPAEQTTREGILAAMQKYLVDLPQKGDMVVFYAASHGSLRVNSKGNKLTVLVNGRYLHADNTLVPSDAYKGGYDVRDREMTRIFNAALDKGIHLTAIFDSCHSGGISRGIGTKYKERKLAFDPRDIAEEPASATDSGSTAPTERTDNPALVFTAVQQDQTAKELLLNGTTTEPHGAFTAALIEALESLPANTPAGDVYQRVKAVLEGGEVPEQEPELDAAAARRRQPLFGGAATDSGHLRAFALKTDDGGNVWLDIGRASGIGVGSEFTSIPADKNVEPVHLRITELQGIARSTAEVVGATGARVEAGETFELRKWIPAESAPLRLWHWAANLSDEQVRAAVAEVRAARVVSVADPAEEPWTHMLSWDGVSWTLQQTGAASAVNLGAPLMAKTLQQHLPPGAKLWVNLPPSQELAAKLHADGGDSNVQVAADLSSAHYALAGALGPDGPAYAWFHKNELVAGPVAAARSTHTPGCSETSPYPVRSDWVAATGSNAIAEPAAVLNNYAARLAKVHGWLELADSPAGATSGGYYSLALLPAANDAALAKDVPVRGGELLRMALRSDERVVEKRWVYVLDIDCRGQGTLIYPGNYAENQFPNAADNGRQFLLPGARTLRVGPPYGMDTLILLSTAQPLPDPYALNFEGATSEGATSRGEFAAQSPLERLLNHASSGTRGSTGGMPVNWGIALTPLHSVPAGENK
jgi:hypothetical protein